jgi:hypothetical protein
MSERRRTGVRDLRALLGGLILTLGASGLAEAQTASLAVQPPSPAYNPKPYLGTDFSMRGSVSGGLAGDATSSKEFTFQYKKEDGTWGTIGCPPNPATTTNTFAICKPAENPPPIRAWTFRLHVKLTKGSQTQTATSSELPYQVKATSKFSTTVWQTFQHDRCMACHAMAWNNPTGAAATARQNHLNRGLTSAQILSGQGCSNCHTITGWRAPEPSKNVNWAGKSATDTCKMARDRFASISTMQRHLKDDKPVQWAINDATVQGNPLAKATPQSLSTWNQKVDEWANGGMGCE